MWKYSRNYDSDDVDRIVEYVLNGAAHHRTHRRLAAITDGFGHRMSGSDALENSIGVLKTHQY